MPNIADMEARVSTIERGTLRNGLTVTGRIGGSGYLGNVAIKSTSAAVTVTATESGKVFIQAAGASTTFTLPANTAAGLVYSFVCGAAGGAILIDPASSNDKFIGKTSGADDGTAVAPASGTGIKNTAATNVAGDHCTLVSNGAGIWYMISVAGVWASQ